MTAKFINEVLFAGLDKFRYPITNVYLYGWESDFFAIQTSKKRDKAYEFEIKVTRQDFRKEHKFKVEKHRVLSQHKNTIIVHRGLEHKARHGIGPCCSFHYIAKNVAMPNRLYYVCPTGIIPHEEVPEYAGLIEVGDDGKMKYVKKAPDLHKERFSMWRLLLDKYHWQWLGFRERNKQLKLKLKNQNDNEEQ